MSQIPLYPMRFEPIYQYRLWGGRHLAELLAAPLPNDGPIGEAWILSDRDDHPSRIANGPLKGQTIGQLMEQSQEQLMGKLARRFRHFPLLLKFLDAHEMLSVQVHPGYAHADLPAAGGRPQQKVAAPPRDGTAKTEAWVVIEAGKESRIYAGLKPGATPDTLRRSLKNGTLADHLVSITPKPGDGVFIPAGTVHSLGDNVVVFEVQQNSDVTFRLYDWGHVDAKTGQPRELEVDQALACADFVDGAAGLVTPVVEAEMPVETRQPGDAMSKCGRPLPGSDARQQPDQREGGSSKRWPCHRERLFDCDAFRLWRMRGESPFTVGAESVPRVLVCTEGSGQVEHNGDTYAVRKGEAWLLPAVVGACPFFPNTAVSLLEIAIPASGCGQDRKASGTESE